MVVADRRKGLPMKRVWIDTHIHVSDIGPDGRRREALCDDLLALLDRCDADLRFVVSCDFPYIGRIAADPAQMLPANRMIHDLVRRAPGRLYGACMVNPNYLEESLRVMEIAFHEWGFVMLGEMLPYAMNYRMEDEASEKVVRLATRYSVPVQVHLGTYWHRDHVGSVDGMDHMRDLLRVASRVPEARYILAHAIGVGPTAEYIPWAGMFLDALAGLFPSYPDYFYLEVRDFQSPALRRTLAEVPATRILSGTDWTTRVGPPFQSYGTMFGVTEEENPFPPRVESFVRFLRDAGASEADIGRIGSENARALLRL
jgi:predicted TIM-barrel fold metal-dependent hydrolase